MKEPLNASQITKSRVNDPEISQNQITQDKAERQLTAAQLSI